MKNSLPLEAPWWSEFRTLFRMSNSIIFMQPPYTSFIKYYEKSFIVEKPRDEQKSDTFQNGEVCYFMQPPYINFLRIYEKCPHILLLEDIMKNTLPLEASWWAKFRLLFKSSKFIFFMQMPYINFNNITKTYLPLEAPRWAELRTLFRMWKFIFFMQPAYTSFQQNIMNKPLSLEESWWADFRKLVRISKCIIFTQPPYTNFLIYYEKSFTFGSILMSRFQKTLKNVEGYYFYAGDIYLFSTILWKILCRWKHLDQLNSDHFSECRSLLCLRCRHVLIFYNIIKNPLPLEASWWAEFRTLFIMSKRINFTQPPYFNF